MKKIVVLLIAILFPCSLLAYGDYQTLEIIAPKASGSGSPAFPSTHRCFYAYPGLTYTFKAQVIGGDYPYTFTLSGAPSGMTIGEHTGVITWTNPTTSASDITMTVYDRDGDSTSSTWSITVGTTGWYFVDDSASSGGDGTIGSPFDNISDIVEMNDEDGRVYFRAGTYTTYTYQAPNYNVMFLDYASTQSPRIWIEYPGEAVTINTPYPIGVSNRTTPYYFHGLRFYNSFRFTFLAYSGASYGTWYDCEFDTITADNNNANESFIYGYDSGTSNYMCVQNCEFHDTSLPSGIGPLYKWNKTLIEENYWHSVQGTDYRTSAIAPKAGNQYLTIRKNTLDCTGGGWGIGGNSHGNFATRSTTPYPTHHTADICYNVVLGASTSQEVVRFNHSANSKSVRCYRNSIIGRVTMPWINAGESCGANTVLTGLCTTCTDPDVSNADETYGNGPFVFEGNVIQSTDGSAYGLYYYYNCGSNPQNYVTFPTNGATGNLIGTSSIIDSNGNLQGDYTSYLGTAGWQIDESEYYDSSPSTPSITGVGLSNAGLH